MNIWLLITLFGPPHIMLYLSTHKQLKRTEYEYRKDISRNGMVRINGCGDSSMYITGMV